MGTGATSKPVALETVKSESQSREIQEPKTSVDDKEQLDDMNKKGEMGEVTCNAVRSFVTTHLKAPGSQLKSTRSPSRPQSVMQPTSEQFDERDVESDDSELSDAEEVYDWCAFDTAQGLREASEEERPMRTPNSKASQVRVKTPGILASPSVRPQPRVSMVASPPRVVLAARGPPPPAARHVVVGSPRAKRSPQRSPASRTPGELVVKDTHEVRRKRASLPSELPHPMPTSGDYMKKRVIINNYILLDSIGMGSYAEVRLCKEKTTDKLYAIKIINKDVLRRKLVQLSGSKTQPSANGAVGSPERRKDGEELNMLDDVKREIAIMKKLSHPHVLRLYEVMDDPNVNKLYLVLEYMKCGDLMQMLNGDSKSYICDCMNERALWHVFRQVGCGLEYLHLQNIVHGDIKPQNLLVGDDGVVKIADFGISKMLQPGEDQQTKLIETAGTPAFMCPEMCAGKSYSGTAADVWAFGATMFMLRFGQPPFVAEKVLQLYYKIMHEPLLVPRPKAEPVSLGLAQLFEAMLTKEPSHRVTLRAVLADEWLRTMPKPQGAPSPGRVAPSCPRPMQPTHNVAIITVTTREVGTAISSHTSRQRPSRDDDADKEVQDGKDTQGQPTKHLGRLEEERRKASFAQRRSKQSIGRCRRQSRSSNADCEAEDFWSDGELVDESNNLDMLVAVEDEVEAQQTSLRIKIRPFAPSTMTNRAARVACAYHSSRGQRPSQEDRVTVVPDLSALGRPELGHYAYIGIFDGHEGAGCATILQHDMHRRLIDSGALFLADPRPALACAFAQVDDAACASLSVKQDYSGSTALVAVVDGARRRVVVAHAGDSRCIVSANGAALALTRDHRLASRCDERARVEAAGGLVVNNRLNGTLAVSRGFGDLAHKNTPSLPPTLTPTPEIAVRPILRDDEFLLLATDGLWDALSQQAAVNFLRIQLNTHANLNKAAKALASHALRKGAIDNITVVIVAFLPPATPSQDMCTGSAIRSDNRAPTLLHL